MAKLHFRFGAMNSGKTTDLLQKAHNYEERGMKVVIAKATIDTKGDDSLVSRIGAKRAVDILLDPTDSLRDRLQTLINEDITKLGCIFIDEAQFMTSSQIDEAFYIAKKDNVPVMAFGLRADFLTNAFLGSKRLFELADSLEELTTICRCGKKARFNGRKINGMFVFSGQQVAIDGEDQVEYESLCGGCYLNAKNNA